MTNTVCKFCGISHSTKWWKCCPTHTTEQGDDVVCQRCQEELHALPPTEREIQFEKLIAIVFVIFVLVLFFWGFSRIGGFK